MTLFSPTYGAYSATGFAPIAQSERFFAGMPLSLKAAAPGQPVCVSQPKKYSRLSKLHLPMTEQLCPAELEPGLLEVPSH